MEFLHCQQCGHWPRFQVGNPQRYFMTNCGHLYCQTCLHALSDKCPSCQGECRIVEVNGQANEEVRTHFKDPLSVLRDALKKPLQILQFQHNQQKDCIRIYGKMMDANKRMSNENAALKAELLRLKQCNEELTKQNQQLQMQRQIIDAGPRPMTFPTANPSQDSGGNDVFNLFREPPPKVMVTPMSCNPSQYTPRVHNASFTMPMVTETPAPHNQMSGNKRPAYSVGFQNLNSQTSPETPLFATPSSSTPQYLIPGSKNSSRQSAEVIGFSVNPMNSQRYSGTPSQTPELISRLRSTWKPTPSSSRSYRQR